MFTVEEKLDLNNRLYHLLLDESTSMDEISSLAEKLSEKICEEMYIDDLISNMYREYKRGSLGTNGSIYFIVKNFKDTRDMKDFIVNDVVNNILDRSVRRTLRNIYNLGLEILSLKIPTVRSYIYCFEIALEDLQPRSNCITMLPWKIIDTVYNELRNFYQTNPKNTTIKAGCAYFIKRSLYVTLYKVLALAKGTYMLADSTNIEESRRLESEWYGRGYKKIMDNLYEY